MNSYFNIKPLLVQLVIAIMLPCLMTCGADEPISFSKDIAPILQAKCVACHGPKTAEADYRMDTFERLVQSPNDVAPIVAGSDDKSELFVRLTTGDADLRMPAESDPLSAESIELFRQWILQGAKFDGQSKTTPLSELSPEIVHPVPPTHYRTSISLSAIGFHPSEDQIFVGGYHEITVWSMEGKLLRRIQNQGERTYSIQFHPTKPWLLSASGTPGEVGEVRLFDLESGNLRSVVARTDEVIMDAAFSPDGSMIAVAMPDGATQILKGEPALLQSTLLGHSGQVTSVCWHVDGNRLATTSRDKTAKVFDVSEGRSVATFTGHDQCVNDLQFIDNDHAISVGNDGRALIWNINNGRKQRDLIHQKQRLLAIARREKDFMIGGENFLQLFEVGSYRHMRTFETATQATTSGTGSNHQSRAIVIGNQAGEVKVYVADKETAHFLAKP